jgi:glycerophosphoryl diester phosphodiesterase
LGPQATMTASSPDDSPDDRPAATLDRKTFLRPIAHRGLHDAARGVIENTAPAFEAAIARGYGIECDLQGAKDATPVVFHDETLDRLIDGTGRLDERTPAELAALHYKGQTTRLLTFRELLELVRGRTPLLVEVKRDEGPPPANFLDNVARQAGAYQGPLALMSFDASTVAAFGALAPSIPRGLVAGSEQLPQRFREAPEKTNADAAVAALLGAAGCVSFLAVSVSLLPAAHAWRARTGSAVPLICWTVRSAADRALAAQWADAPTFEGYEP